ncbi:hypothetical protein EX30DRAFT_342336 [Ascodesmis nigricans]|uniref:Uncharacterized protein n=1 Tax=Ascodesmis nigricans TaxID=341454 RepID=A0A4S2MSV9_9PEZI|nr:hypothetical protein EX30DRAFT_342336 [Ascodesmis nigricans]
MQFATLILTAAAAISVVNAASMSPYAVHNGVVVKALTGDHRVDAQECCPGSRCPNSPPMFPIPCCADGTQGTPYCGYGPCNIFGCNCDGGCRK